MFRTQFYLVSTFNREMLRLEIGVTLKVRNKTRKWYGTVLNFAGDMPASNFVGDSKKVSVSQTYPIELP